jgi:hypothetical protein
MKVIVASLFAFGALVTSASAQVPLSGQYQCLQNCTGPSLAFVTQNGWDLNLVNEAGQPARAWIDYRGHIWVDRWDEGAMFSPDGLTIQFDNGTVWRRAVPVPVVLPAPPPVLQSRG